MTTSKDLFLDALELDGPARADLLKRTAESDPVLAERVQALLDAHFKMSKSENNGHSWLGPVPTARDLFGEFKQDLSKGQDIGPYKLLREIGRGGFGRVWLAQQTEPVSRRVAVKVLRSDLDTDEITSRFLAERQAVALMDHPAIARIFDGGSTESGQPWFAMEHVDGIPITAYCETNRLDLNQRLELFVATCRAIQHAHQRGIVHRDIKPNNVLVTTVDGKPQPKVIDFGIAKAIEQSLTDAVLETQAGQMMGTPASLSPEQVGHAADVDTRTDIYSLGVLLFEMLSGVHPCADMTGDMPPLLELLERVRLEDPLRPSERIEADKSGSPGHLIRPRDLRGDLDWITMRCLEKDRERRYESAAQLAGDIIRHLQGDTVLAGPPTFGYRAGKLARRHKGGLAFVAMVMVLLTTGFIVAMIQASQTAVELQRFEAINEVLEGALMSLDPSEAQGKDPELLLDMLGRTQTHIDSKQLHPKVEASVRRVLGRAYMSIARYEEAQAELERSLLLRFGMHGDEHPETEESLSELAALLLVTGRPTEAVPYFERAYVSARSLFGNNSQNTASALVNLTTAHMNAGNFAQVVPDLQTLVDWHIEELGEQHQDSLLARNNLAIALSNSGDQPAALEHYKHLFRIQTERLGDSDPITLRARNNLGSLYTELDLLDEALPLMEDALAIKRKILPSGHPSLLTAYSGLARLLTKMERPEPAEKLYDEALAQGVEAHGHDFRHVQILKLNRANLLLSLDRTGEAGPVLGDLLESVNRTEPEGSALLDAVQKAHAKAVTGQL